MEVGRLDEPELSQSAKCYLDVALSFVSGLIRLWGAEAASARLMCALTQFHVSGKPGLEGETSEYVYDHSGHIFCGEGFDWRYNNISINDPYPENDPAPPNGVGRGSSGGDTYGHNTYSRGTIANGVLALYTHGMIY
jgi:hypothetical protein